VDMTDSSDSRWPILPWDEWKDTADTLHMLTQIVGHTRLALCAPRNHWWHVVFYVTARGLTTSPIPWRGECFDVEFDFVDHRLVIRLSSGAMKALPLRAQSVAEFYREYMGALTSMGIEVTIHSGPDEVAWTDELEAGVGVADSGAGSWWPVEHPVSASTIPAAKIPDPVIALGIVADGSWPSQHDRSHRAGRREPVRAAHRARPDLLAGHPPASAAPALLLSRSPGGRVPRR